MAETPNWNNLSSSPPGSSAASPPGAATQSTPDWDDLSSSPEEAKYGTAGQTALTAAEQFGQGALGPVAPLIEKGLTQIGVPGLSPEEQRGRESVHPVLSGVSKAAGFAGSLITGEGIAPLIGKVGELATGAAGLGKTVEGLSTLQKIAQTGVQASAEMAALQTADEVSKVINQDPEQGLGSAAINIGLAGLMGAAGGAALGAVAPAWNTVKNKLGVEKLATDFMGETKFLREHPDLGSGATNEITERLNQVQNLMNKIGDLKSNVISETLPEATPENLGVIDAHLNDISDKGEEFLEKMSGNAYTKGSAGKLAQDLQDFQEVISRPDATIGEKWDALNQYKQASQAHANYNTFLGGPEEKALSAAIKPFNALLRKSLEDSEVWGSAADVQKKLNKALTDFYDTQKDFLGKVTSKELGDRVADPDRVQTLLNQAGKGKAALKTNAVNNYLEASQDLSDAVKSIHLENNIPYDANAQLNPTPILNRVLNTEPTVGAKLAQLAQAKGASLLSNSVGEGAAGALGSVAGLLAGHPLAGAYIAEKILGPAFSALAKPFAENAVNSEAMKSSIDYAVNILRGQETMNNSVKNIFKAGAEIVPRELLPTPESRKRLQGRLDSFSDNPQNLLQVGGNISHYMPNHASSAAALTATAKDYFQSLKPKTVQNAPLDVPKNISKIDVAKYNRQLDIAQQPLLVLQHIKNGTLQQQDLITLNTLYPGLHKQLISKINEELIGAVHNKLPIPYFKRLGLSQLLGVPLDSTITPVAAQAIIGAAAGQQMAKSNQKPPHKATAVELNQINKVNALYATKSQSAAINDRQR